MARESDGGKGSRINVYPMPRPTTESPWSLVSYPRPDESLVPDENREKEICEERLFWRSDGRLACGAGLPYFADERHLMVTRYELEHPPPPPKRRGRPPKVREMVSE